MATDNTRNKDFPQTTSGRRRALRRLGQRGGVILDVVLYLTALCLLALLLAVTIVAPASRRAGRAEIRVERVEAEVQAIANRVKNLKQEVSALQSDPIYIERMLRIRTKELMPHRFQPQELPGGSIGLAPAPGPTSSATSDGPTRSNEH
ncbi:MAG: FtsB/FtsL family cell division protein [Planctomycetota bacterium]|jgi:hypothetical protein